MRLLLLILLIILIVPSNISAQFWEIQGMAGTTIYHGDLAPDFSMQPPGIATAILVRRNLDSRLALRIGGSFGMISATDSRSLNIYRKARNLNFKSSIFEGSVGLEFNFFRFHYYQKKENQFTPYILACIGLFYHNPIANYNGINYSLQAMGTEGQAPGQEYSLVQPAFIIGGGFKIDIDSKWAIVIEGATRILFFDYLDDVSGEYANSKQILAHRGSLGPVAVALSDRSGEVGQNLGTEGSQRGNSKTNDGYTMFSIGIIYTIHQQKCPNY
ncbi:MAG: DUF6089 family protein [Saprospiraceae bacterium]|nr:DUF6089 family protein [Saprospiraceae bacterium]